MLQMILIGDYMKGLENCRDALVTKVIRVTMEGFPGSRFVGKYITFHKFKVGQGSKNREVNIHSVVPPHRT